jgi:hypothetical protein
VRRLWLLGIALAVALFLALSALLARALTVDGAERSAITSLIGFEARGDAAAMAAQITGCQSSSACPVRVAAIARSLARRGNVTIIQIQPSAGFSLGSTLGLARVAWRVGSSLPVVQCVEVQRAGNVLSGLRVELLALSARIKTDGVCPGRVS